MHIRADAIVCAVRTHGENGTIVRLLTREDGLLAGYVRGGRSRRLRPVLMPGNKVVAELRARVDTQLPGLTVELIESRAPLLAEPLPAAAIEWITVLSATALPEGQPYPSVYDALEAMIATIAFSPAARAWAGVLARFERGLLTALGYGEEDEEERGLFAALEENELRLSANLLTGRAAQVLDARERLVERLRRALLPHRD
ncbi:MAG TPA: recombination protein O N-terminal domain-containing protein [Sphingomonas sp.]|nr:recombination protein O N-terminal domain-containing protein [Sphingomonas sp.]